MRVICHWRDVSLKIRLVERGLQPWEIAQIVNAGRWEEGHRIPEPKSPGAESQPPQDQTAAGRKADIRTFGGFSSAPDVERRGWFGWRRKQEMARQPASAEAASAEVDTQAKASA